MRSRHLAKRARSFQTAGDPRQGRDHTQIRRHRDGRVCLKIPRAERVRVPTPLRGPKGAKAVVPAAGRPGGPEGRRKREQLELSHDGSPRSGVSNPLGVLSVSWLLSWRRSLAPATRSRRGNLQRENLEANIVPSSTVYNTWQLNGTGLASQSTPRRPLKPLGDACAEIGRQ